MEGNQLLKTAKVDKNKSIIDIAPLCPSSEIDYP